MISWFCFSVAVVLGAPGSVAQQQEPQPSERTDRLESERAALDALSKDEQGLRLVLDVIERAARAKGDRLRLLARRVSAMTKGVEEARDDADAATQAQRSHEARLGPTLFLLYRLKKRSALEFMIESADFAALIKRQHAVKTVVELQVRDLGALVELSEAAQLRSRRSALLESTAETYLRALREEQSLTRSGLVRLNELLASARAEKDQRSRVLAELEANEAELNSMVDVLSVTSAASGFRARLGQLPMPTRGMVEVPYGKIVNARFNTVTIHQGIDLRAPKGVDVVAVAEGTVVYCGVLKGYGNVVIIDHGGDYHSVYAHLSEVQVEVGNEIEESETIAQVGDTGSLKGAYLYFEIRRRGRAIDPLPWFIHEG